jgi:multiple sugar transport system substrate-binding protein
VPTGFTHTTLLNISSWVWAAGGDFISPDGKATRFMEPASLAGMATYFRLGRFLAPEVRRLSGLEPENWFLQERETALTISGAWLFNQAQEQEAEGKRIDAAVPLGASFVGGSNLVIWKYSRDPEAALKLIRFLTRTQAELFYCPRIGLLPARAAALGQPPFSIDRFWQTAVRGMQTGRSFPAIRLWGLVEDRLTSAFYAVWTEVLADPTANPEAILVRHLSPLAARLDPLLAKG